jgi:hypothetical protein
MIAIMCPSQRCCYLFSVPPVAQVVLKHSHSMFLSYGERRRGKLCALQFNFAARCSTKQYLRIRFLRQRKYIAPPYWLMLFYGTRLVKCFHCRNTHSFHIRSVQLCILNALSWNRKLQQIIFRHRPVVSTWQRWRPCLANERNGGVTSSVPHHTTTSWLGYTYTMQALHFVCL